jgi:hypothetical protein
MVSTDGRNEELTDNKGQGVTFASVETTQGPVDSQKEGSEDRERKAAKAAGASAS